MSQYVLNQPFISWRKHSTDNYCIQWFIFFLSTKANIILINVVVLFLAWSWCIFPYLKWCNVSLYLSMRFIYFFQLLPSEEEWQLFTSGMPLIFFYVLTHIHTLMYTFTLVFMSAISSCCRYFKYFSLFDISLA